MLLDSDLHVQIAGFGLMHLAEATVTTSTWTFEANFAAPELFGMCTECCQWDCEGCTEDHDERHGSKTTKTDVYAFGRLYYAVRFECTSNSGC